ncbi:uncharacterized protein LOC141602284 [Silene latifolia]|uniref:uncharacterized protein LOC141602284 n=1 Tax=Silene latifolia TaxID=37657 RepID=UPI003D76DAA0
MKGLSWNCRGFNDTLSPAIPKLRALVSSNKYDFLFLAETKCSVHHVNSLLRSSGFVESVGVDALGASGGLWVGWRKGLKMKSVVVYSNFVILLMDEYASLPWYLILFYGEPNSSLRLPILEELSTWIESFVYPFIIFGDFNQVEYKCDKVSGSKRPIAGANSFNCWKIDNELVDIPFKGPRFTWCNNRKGNKRVYERIDKALGSKEWLLNFPNTAVKHFPIQLSDHAPVELNLHLIKRPSKKPYKLEWWNLENEECLGLIQNTWRTRIRGSPVFRLMRKLASVSDMN